MTVGLSVAGLANRVLNHLVGGAVWSQPAGLWVQLHLGDPGAAGTASPSLVSARSPAFFNSAAAGSVSMTTPAPQWTMTSTEVVSHVSVWSAASGGTFLWSAQLAVAKNVGSGDTLTLNSCGMALSPVAS